jgi:putative sigma-54 modulation protein
MNVEYTGRQFQITPATRKQVHAGLEKIHKVLGSNFDTHVVFSVERHRHIVEITITVRNRPPIVGLAEAADVTSAVSKALDKIERQTLKYKTRSKSKKKKARKREQGKVAVPEETFLPAVVGGDLRTAVPLKVHSFPSSVKFKETYVVRNGDSVSHKPLTVEEAVKEAEFRDREVFVFRDLEGQVKVLHRKKDGKMELIEAP